MPSASNAKIQAEAGQTLVDFVALTDQGDHIDFRSASSLWSAKSGYAPVVKPNGVVAGGVISPADSGDDNKIDVSELRYLLAGGDDGASETLTAQTDVTVYRAQSAGTHIVNSITVATGGSLAVVRGTSSGSSAFSDTRGATGGPPWIPTTSIEVGQVRFSASADAAVASSDIYQVVGTNQERFDYPNWTVNYANVDNQVLGYAGIDFDFAAQLIHSDNGGTTTATKKVYAKYYTPSFAELANATDFQPADTSSSVTSTQVYGNKTINSVSQSLGQAQFTYYPGDNITDFLVKEAEVSANLWFRYYQDRTKSPYVLTQGIVSATRTNPANANISMAVTVSPETRSRGVAV